MTDAQESFYSLIKNAPFGIYVVDSNFRLVETSAGAKRAFSQAEPLIGRDFAGILRIICEESFAIEIIDQFRNTLATGESYQSLSSAEKSGNADAFERGDCRLERITLPDGSFGAVCYFYDLTERQRVEKKLRESEELNKLILNSMSAHLAVLDNEGNIIAVNEAWQRFSTVNCKSDGHPAENYGVGANYLEICRSAKGELSDEAETVYLGIKEVLEGKSDAFALEYPCHSPSELRWFYLTCTPLKSTNKGAVISHTDITSRKIAEENLRNSEMRYRLLFEDNPFPMIIYDFDTLKIIDANEATCRHYCWTREELTQMTIADFAIIDDLQSAIEKVQLNKDGRTIYGNWKHKKKDGTEIVVETASHRLEIEGENLRIVLINDVSEKVRAGEELRAAEQRFRATFEQAAVGIAHVAPDGKWLMVNERLCEITGYTKEELSSLTFQDITHPDDLKKDLNYANSVLAGEIETYSTEKRYIRKDKSVVWINLTVSLTRGVDGSPKYFISVIEDISLRKAAETEMRQWADAFENCAQGIALGDPRTNKIIAVNSTLAHLCGKPKSEIVNHPILSVYDESTHDFVKKHLAAADQTGSVQYEALIKRGNGTSFPVQMDIVSVRSEAGDVLYRVATMQDISERKKAEEEIRESQRHFRELSESLPQLVWTCRGDDGMCDYLSPQWVEYTGIPEAEQLGFEWLNQIHPADRQKFIGAWKLAVENNTDYEAEFRIRRFDGVYRWFQTRAHPLRDEDGKIVKWFGTNTDVEDRKQIENALRESEGKLRLFVEFVPVAVVMLDREMKYLAVSRRWMMDFNLEGDIIGRSHYDLFPEIPERWKEIHRRVLKGAVERCEEEKFVRDDGAVQWIRWEVRPWFNSSNEIGGIIIFSEDITERKVAEENLRQSEEKLRQSQKMEAVGRLAGGIAHDFNNMLTVIKGYSDLSLQLIPKENSVHNYIEEIKRAGERSSSLTHQLLAFSRTQILQPEVLSLNQIISETMKMLKFVIGEDIEIILRLAPHIGQIKADPGQISQVLMNLLVNARDAMPFGGTITIKTENVFLEKDVFSADAPEKPGNYVRLEVQDTGEGMDSQTMQNIFEPFYTTKEVGKGTGLGLSTVYGIIMQSGGHILVKSNPGIGTSFEIFLPHILEENTIYNEKISTKRESSGNPVILVVEDEELVRNLMADALQACGYDVFTACNGAEAIRLIEKENLRVDLLITDIVMPEVSGYELFRSLSESMPDPPKFLFTSGYLEDERIKNSGFEIGSNFIQKPFQLNQLALKVQEILSLPE